jgi:hypothetical protein
VPRILLQFRRLLHADREVEVWMTAAIALYAPLRGLKGPDYRPISSWRQAGGRKRRELRLSDGKGGDRCTGWGARGYRSPGP